MEKGRYIILIGNYGSGKTEIALNIAIRAAARGERTQVIDLDKVNDYFRMSDRVELLEQNKIDVVSPTFAGKGLTPSNMSAAVASAFAQDWDLVVFDVGGDSAGAMSLGRYHSDFAALEPEQLEAPPPGRRSVPGSLVWVPASAGLLLCQHVVTELIKD